MCPQRFHDFFAGAEFFAEVVAPLQVEQSFVVLGGGNEFRDGFARGDALFADKIKIYRFAIVMPLASISASFPLDPRVFVPAQDQKMSAARRRDARGVALEQADEPRNQTLQLWIGGGRLSRLRFCSLILSAAAKERLICLSAFLALESILNSKI